MRLLPTIVTHPVIPLAIASLATTKNVSGRLLLAGVIASILPDADVIAFKFDIPYDHAMGHRGFSHSIAFALIIGLLGIFTAQKLNANRIVVFLFLFLSTLSHGMLDALTNGGLGIGFFSPFSNERFLFPWRPIQVSPLSIEPFLRARGWRVFQSELIWVWAPTLTLAFFGIALRKGFRWLTNR